MDGLTILFLVCIFIVIVLLIGYWNHQWLKYFWECFLDALVEREDNIRWRIEARKKRKSGETKV